MATFFLKNISMSTFLVAVPMSPELRSSELPFVFAWSKQPPLQIKWAFETFTVSTLEQFRGLVLFYPQCMEPFLYSASTSFMSYLSVCCRFCCLDWVPKKLTHRPFKSGGHIFYPKVMNLQLLATPSSMKSFLQKFSSLVFNMMM